MVGEGGDSFVGGKIGRMRGAEFLRVMPYFRLFFGGGGIQLFILKILRGKERLSRGLYFSMFKKNFKCEGCC